MTTTPEVEHPRTIRSYVIRGGRLTTSQQHALDNYWSTYGIADIKGPLDCSALFGRQAPVVMEIGFGMGDSLLAMARTNPDKNFIGVEVHPPGIGNILREIAEQNITNLRIYKADAKDVLDQCIADASLSKIQIYFPDPWHKTKHHKRRLIQSEFVQQIRPKLKVGAIVHLATDWEAYAKQMMKVMSSAEGFRNCLGEHAWASDPMRPSTKFEQRGQRLGHAVWDLVFEKNV